MMKAAMILGIIGSLAISALGYKWVSDYKKYEGTIVQMEELSKQMGAQGALADSIGKVKKLRNTGNVMMGLGLLALLASIIVFKLGKLSGIIMLTAVLIPGIMAPRSLAISSILLLAGILTLMAKRKTPEPI